MNKLKKIFAAVAAICFILVLTAGAESIQRVADISVGSSGIYMQPRGNFEKIVLSVSCADGKVFHKTFSGGSAPYLDIADIANRIDGSYTYELRAIPQGTKRTRKNSNYEENFQKSIVQSGAFTIKAGSIVNMSTPEKRLSTTQDQVIADDLVVQSSLCVGYDCINGENFGFDTMRLKENNLRFHFDDTSNTGSFPSNDWRITINDSTNGGASYFSIDDATHSRAPFRIEAGAPNYSLYVEDYGRIGFGTSTPVVELHIADGDTPTVRLDQDGSSGWSPQIWDVAGNEANFFIRDATNGSKLPFRIQPSTPGDTLCLKSSGYVGIGTWSPAVKFEVKTTGEHAVIRATRTDGATGQISAKSDKVMIGSYTNHPMSLSINQDPKVFLATSGNVGIGVEEPTYLFEVNNSGSTSNAYCDGVTWHDVSTRAAKENIHELALDDALAAVKELVPVRYNYKSIKEDERVGFIAEDVPELVAMKDRKSMSAMDVTAVLTKVVQEQQRLLQEQQQTISELKQKVEALEEQK